MQDTRKTEVLYKFQIQSSSKMKCAGSRQRSDWFAETAAKRVQQVPAARVAREVPDGRAKDLRSLSELGLEPERLGVVVRYDLLRVGRRQERRAAAGVPEARESADGEERGLVGDGVPGCDCTHWSERTLRDDGGELDLTA